MPQGPDSADDRWQGALCRETDPALFFPEDLKDSGMRFEAEVRARAICADCPVRVQCLEYVLEYEGRKRAKDRFGIYGGMTGEQRRRYVRSGTVPPMLGAADHAYIWRQRASGRSYKSIGRELGISANEAFRAKTRARKYFIEYRSKDMDEDAA